MMNRKYLGSLAFVLVLSIASSVAVYHKGSVMEAAEAAAVKKVEFRDLSGHWGQQTIEQAIQKGYVDGYEDGTFRPEWNVSRAEFLKMAVTALKIGVSGQGSGNDWYVPYVNAAVSGGIHQYADFTSGDWNTPITRLEMARIAVRASGSQNDDAKKWMYAATKAGLITGMDDTGSLGVDEATTRAQSVTIIERILDVKAGKQLPTDKHAVSRAEVVWHKTNIYTMWPRYFGGQRSNMLDLDKFQWDSSDGIYHEEVVEYVVVDMEDPNDPFRGEVEGMPFRYVHYSAEGNILGGTIHEAPEKSYVTYSKVKQVITGQFPKDLWVARGGGVNISPVVPLDVSNNARDNWEYYYSEMETPDTIYYSKYTEGQEYVEWNMARGNNPYYLENIPSSGGTYYWEYGQVHPKGDLYSYNGIATYITYTPSISYMNKYGPKKDKDRSFTDLTDYTKHNE